MLKKPDFLVPSVAIKSVFTNWRYMHDFIIQYGRRRPFWRLIKLNWFCHVSKYLYLYNQTRVQKVHNYFLVTIPLALKIPIFRYGCYPPFWIWGKNTRVSKIHLIFILEGSFIHPKTHTQKTGTNEKFAVKYVKNMDFLYFKNSIWLPAAILKKNLVGLPTICF